MPPAHSLPALSFLLFPSSLAFFQVSQLVHQTLCGSQLVNAPPIASFLYPDLSLPLQSPVGGAPHSVRHSGTFLPCPPPHLTSDPIARRPWTSQPSCRAPGLCTNHLPPHIIFMEIPCVGSQTPLLTMTHGIHPLSLQHHSPSSISPSKLAAPILVPAPVSLPASANSGAPGLVKKAAASSRKINTSTAKVPSIC